MRGSWRVTALVVVAVSSAMALGGCGGDEVTSKQEFVEHMMATTVTPQDGADGERWREIYGCTYDKIADTDLVDQLLEIDRGEAPSEALSAEVSKVLGECLTEVPPPVTTTSVASSVTTTSVTSSVTTTTAPAG